LGATYRYRGLSEINWVKNKKGNPPKKRGKKKKRECELIGEKRACLSECGKKKKKRGMFRGEKGGTIGKGKGGRDRCLR